MHFLVTALWLLVALIGRFSRALIGYFRSAFDAGSAAATLHTTRHSLRENSTKQEHQEHKLQ